MSQPLPNRFQEFELDEKEELAATAFHDLHVMWFYNQRAKVANDKLNLKFNPEKPQEFMQNEASLEGQLKILDYIIAIAADSSEKQRQLQPTAKQGV